MKNNIVMLAFASILATTATDWAVAAEVVVPQSQTTQSINESLLEADMPALTEEQTVQR